MLVGIDQGYRGMEEWGLMHDRALRGGGGGGLSPTAPTERGLTGREPSLPTRVSRVVQAMSAALRLMDTPSPAGYLHPGDQDVRTRQGEGPPPPARP